LLRIDLVLGLAYLRAVPRTSFGRSLQHLVLLLVVLQLITHGADLDLRSDFGQQL